MTFSLNTAITAPRLAQVAAGGAALYGGWKVASGIVRSAYHEDMLGDRKRIVRVDGDAVIFQIREPQGGKLTSIMMGAGAASAFAGGALLGSNLLSGNALMRQGGGAALIALGIGAIAGATAISAQYSGTDFERRTEPSAPATDERPRHDSNVRPAG